MSSSGLLIREKYSTVTKGTYLVAEKFRASEIPTIIKLSHAIWDADRDRLAVGTETLSLSETIPANAFIMGVLIDVTTAITGGSGADIALGLVSTTDLQAAAAVSGAPWSTVSRKFAAKSFKLTAEETAITMTITDAALTAGSMNIWVKYLCPMVATV